MNGQMKNKALELLQTFPFFKRITRDVTKEQGVIVTIENYLHGWKIICKKNSIRCGNVLLIHDASNHINNQFIYASMFDEITTFWIRESGEYCVSTYDQSFNNLTCCNFIVK
ncbi:hypothetical protein QTN25_009397 [Entamoeba marina]